MMEGKPSNTSLDFGIALIQKSQSIEEDFINSYKNLPELWDTENVHYTTKRKRLAALDILLEILKRWNPSATRYSVRQKINILRSTYKKDLKKYLGSRRVKSDGEEIYEYEPKNWKFHALRFLDKNGRPQNHDIVEININNNNFEDDTSDDSIHDELSSRPSDMLSSLPENKAIRETSTKRVKVEMEDENYTENDKTLARELDAIGANVICKLKRMNPQQRYHAELLINKVLITGLKNHLTDDTELTEVQWRP